MGMRLRSETADKMSSLSWECVTEWMSRFIICVSSPTNNTTNQRYLNSATSNTHSVTIRFAQSKPCLEFASICFCSYRKWSNRLLIYKGWSMMRVEVIFCHQSNCHVCKSYWLRILWWLCTAKLVKEELGLYSFVSSSWLAASQRLKML